MSLEGRAKDVFPSAKKPESRHQDSRYAGKTVNKARQQQKRELVVGNIVRNAERTRAMGMEISPEQEWVMNNRALFL